MTVWRLKTSSFRTSEKREHGIYASKELAEKAKEKIIQEYIDFGFVFQNDKIKFDDGTSVTEIVIEPVIVIDS